MTESTSQAAGVRSAELDLSGPTSAQPSGVPAAVVGTSTKGRAFLPMTFATVQDFEREFGKADGKHFGPLAVHEWMRNARAGTFVRVLGVGDGKQRSSVNGTVNKAGFVVGNEQIQLSTKLVGPNLSAYGGTDARQGLSGRTYFLGAYMEPGGKIFEDAGITAAGADKHEPILRGVLMVPSGVVPTLSSSFRAHGQNDAPLGAVIPRLPSKNNTFLNDQTVTGVKGGAFGDISAAGEFVLLLNGFKSTAENPGIISASFDRSAGEAFFGTKLNKDPTKIEKLGHYLYTYYDVHPSIAKVTSDVTKIKDLGASANQAAGAGFTAKCFILSGAGDSNSFNAGGTRPNYENFEERFQTAKSPFVISQKFGSSPKNLFRFHQLDDGALREFDRVKITIENIKASTATYDDFGTFDVLVREMSDIDTDRKVIERYTACSLDPTSDDYIARKIGDFHLFYDFDRREGSQRIRHEGLYPNVSARIRVEMHPDVENNVIEKRAIPCGFRGAPHLLTRMDDPTKPVLLNAVGGDAADATATDANGVEAREIGESGALGATDALRSVGLTRMVELPVPMRENLLKDDLKTVNSSFTWGMQFERKTNRLKPNSGRTMDETWNSFVKFFPQDTLRNPGFQVFDNEGTAKKDGVEYDCDVFNNNLFTLERVQVVTGAFDLPDVNKWDASVYRRTGVKTTLTDKDGKTHSAEDTRFLDPSKDFKPGDNATQYLGFTMALFGGFDGNNMFNKERAQMTDFGARLEMENPSMAGSSENTVSSFKKAIDVLTERSDSDIQLLAIPGMRHPAITNHGIDAVENRFDAMYIMDIEEMDLDNVVLTGSNIDTEGQLISVENTVRRLRNRNLDTSFAAAYFPDVTINKPKTTSTVDVPPSVVVLGGFSLNDSVAHPWFAPAGFSRGRLTTTVRGNVNLNTENLDILYDSDINPLRPHPQHPEDGVVMWGQKTLLQATSALDRVNVRRLLIDIRRKVKAVAHKFLFEPNREDTLASFSALVTPILNNVQAERGVSRFKVQIDTSTTTQADVENNTIRGKIFLQPIRSLEFVELTFVVANQGAEI